MVTPRLSSTTQDPITHLKNSLPNILECELFPRAQRSQGIYTKLVQLTHCISEGTHNEHHKTLEHSHMAVASTTIAGRYPYVERDQLILKSTDGAIDNSSQTGLALLDHM